MDKKILGLYLTGDKDANIISKECPPRKIGPSPPTANRQPPQAEC